MRLLIAKMNAEKAQAVRRGSSDVCDEDLDVLAQLEAELDAARRDHEQVQRQVRSAQPCRRRRTVGRCVVCARMWCVCLCLCVCVCVCVCVCTRVYI